MSKDFFTNKLFLKNIKNKIFQRVFLKINYFEEFLYKLIISKNFFTNNLFLKISKNKLFLTISLSINYFLTIEKIKYFKEFSYK